LRPPTSSSLSNLDSSDTQTAAEVTPIKKIQIGEWKYCNDHNLSHTARTIRDEHTTLADAISQHILPLVMSRTVTPHSSTMSSLTSLLTLRTDPLDKLISKTRLLTRPAS
jgi:hypothetical protein